MKLRTNQLAPDFTGETIEGKPFQLSSLKGSKILLSLFRNGACALCNLRIHELIKRYEAYEVSGLKIVAVFESSKEDMIPYVGKQSPPFLLLADPLAKIYELYGSESSPETIQKIQESEAVHKRIEEARQTGFELIHQENSNFFRLPADFLIREDFTIEKAVYKDEKSFEHVSFEEIENFINPVVSIEL